MNRPLSIAKKIIKSRQIEKYPGLKLLRKLTSINSATHNVTGVNQVQKLVRKELQDLGFATELKEDPNGISGPLLHGRLASTKNTRTVTMVCHADTVFDSQSRSGRKLYLEDDRVIGPGVADNKGGIVVIIQGLKHFLKNNPANININVVCSPNEETGSHGFHDLFNQIGRETDIVLGFEPATSDGSIINDRCGNRWYKLKCRGIEAHAGRAKGEEINAAHELIFKLNKLLDLKAKYDDLKINVAGMSGGKDRYNITCGHAEMKVDVRFGTFKTRDEIHDQIVHIANQSFVTSTDGLNSVTTWKLDDDCPPMQKTEASEYYSNVYKKIIEDLEGKDVGVASVGGASDCNYFTQIDNVAFDGLGPVAGKIHTDSEYIEGPSLDSRARALAKFLELVAADENGEGS